MTGNNQESQVSGVNPQASSQNAPMPPPSDSNASTSFLSRFLGEPSPLLDTDEDCRRDSLYRLPCLAGIVGLLVGMSSLYLIAHKYSSHSPLAELFLGLFPFQVFTFGFCFLAMLPMIFRDGFRKSLDFITPAPTFKEIAKYILKSLIILYPIVTVMNYISQLICETLSIKTQEQLISTLGKGSDSLYWACAAISAIVLAPITEEIMIRLVLNRAVRSIMPLWATLISTFAFMLMHGTPQYWPSLFLVGLFLLRARRVYGLKCAILLHSTYNLIAFAFIFIEQIIESIRE